jgi:hypothetical protein
MEETNDHQLRINDIALQGGDPDKVLVVIRFRKLTGEDNVKN